MRKANYLPNRFIQEENLSSAEITSLHNHFEYWQRGSWNVWFELQIYFHPVIIHFSWISIFTGGAQNFASLLGLKLLALNNSFWSEKSSSYKSQMLITLDWLSCNAARSWKFNIRYETILERGYNWQRQANWVKL